MELRPVLLSPTFRQDPETLYATLREEQPVCYAEDLQFYFLTRYDDIRDALRNPAISRDPRHSARFSQDTGGATPLRDKILVENPFSADGAKHRRLRRMLIRTFSDRALSQIEESITSIVNDAAQNRFPKQGDTDVMAFIKPVPMSIIARMLGLDSLGMGCEEFTTIANDFFLGIYSFASADDLARSERATATLLTLFDELIHTVESRKLDNLTFRMLQNSKEEGGITTADLQSVIISLLAAGTETTAYQAGFLVHDLLAHPEQWQQLQADRSLMSQAIAESTRYNLTSSLAAERYLVEDVNYSGVTIPRGATLQLSMQAANNDPTAFEEPRRFNIHRAANGAIPFGHGEHMCIGIHLARSEITAVVNKVLDLLPDPHSVRLDSAEYIAGRLDMRGLSSLRITIDPTQASSQNTATS
jgi:cytochrome P450